MAHTKNPRPPKTPEQREAWAAYMREYRITHKPQPVRGGAPTARQLQILRLYCDPVDGGNQAKIAEILGVTTSAVHNQLGALMKRLGVKTPAQAIFKVMSGDQKGSK